MPLKDSPGKERETEKQIDKKQRSIDKRQLTFVTSIKGYHFLRECAITITPLQ